MRFAEHALPHDNQHHDYWVEEKLKADTSVTKENHHSLTYEFMVLPLNTIVPCHCRVHHYNSLRYLC